MLAISSTTLTCGKFSFQRVEGAIGAQGWHRGSALTLEEWGCGGLWWPLGSQDKLEVSHHGFREGAQGVTLQGLDDSFAYGISGVSIARVNASVSKCLMGNKMWGEKEIKPDPGLVNEEGMATHSSTLVWRIPWTEEPGRLWSIGSHN